MGLQAHMHMCTSMRNTVQDPYLTGRLAAAFVRGLQGNDSTYIKVNFFPGC